MMHFGFYLSKQDGQVQEIVFVSSDVPTFHAVLRKCIFSFMRRLSQSENGVFMALAVPAQSDTK